MSAPRVIPSAVPLGDGPFDRLAGELLADELAASPTGGSALGLTAYDPYLPDLSADALAARHRAEDAWAERFAALADADLSPDERIDRDLVHMTLRGRALMRDWEEWRRSPDAYAGVALSSVFTLLLHRLRPERELAPDVAARLRATPDLLAQGQANLDPELASPLLVRRALSQARAGGAYCRAIAGEISDESFRAEVAAAGEVAGLAFDEFVTHLEGLAEKARGGWAIGEERYDGLLRNAEGLTYGAREMRDRGQATYDELAARMRAYSRELRGDDDWRALLETLNTDHPPTPEAMRDEYAEVTAAARAFCVEHDLVTLPPGEECRVVPSAPFTRAMLAVAHYIPPPPFSDRRAGHFFVPYPPDGATPEQVEGRLATNSRASMWTISAHEAYPGHHWHLAHLAASGTRPLRLVYGSTYFTEGWGLYSEELMREQDFFPEQRAVVGQLDARLFRAARIVVDTSLHLGEMTVEQAVEYMSTKASLSPETAQAEVSRYCAWPTQAASYLTGALEIARMRDDWLAAGRGSLREFHDTAAGTGRLPIVLVGRCLGGA
ncbi:MAG: DUF885 domain-containing protein [Actinomycetes bacterium]